MSENSSENIKCKNYYVKISYQDHRIKRTVRMWPERNSYFTARVITIKLTQTLAMKRPFDPPSWIEKFWDSNMVLPKAAFETSEY